MNPRKRISIGTLPILTVAILGCFFLLLSCEEEEPVEEPAPTSTTSPPPPPNQAPIFKEREYARSALHGSVPGVLIGEPIPFATDPEGHQITYSIRPRNDNELQGKLSVSTTEDGLQVMAAEQPRLAMNFNLHHFTITADDGNEGRGTTTLVIRMQVPPGEIIFETYDYRFNPLVRDLNDAAFVLGTIRHVTQLVDGVTFELTGVGGHEDLFMLETSGRNAAIKWANAGTDLDGDTTYNLEVTGRKGNSRTGTTSVRISFNNPPVFTPPEAFSVYENDQRGNEPGGTPYPPSANMVILDLDEHVEDADGDDLSYEILEAKYKVNSGDGWTNQGSLVYVYEIRGSQLRKVGGGYFYYDRISNEPRTIRERRVRIRARDEHGARVDFWVEFSMRDVNDQHSTVTGLFQTTLPVPYNVTNGHVITGNVYSRVGGTTNSFLLKDVDTFGSFTNGQTSLPRNGNNPVWHIAWDDDEDTLDIAALIYYFRDHQSVRMFGTKFIAAGSGIGERKMQLVVTNNNFIASRNIGERFVIYFSSGDGVSHSIAGLISATVQITNQRPTFDAVPVASTPREIAANHDLGSFVLTCNSNADSSSEHLITATGPTQRTTRLNSASSTTITSRSTQPTPGFIGRSLSARGT